MEELEIFIKLCTKKELIDHIKLTDTKVNGFTRNFQNAPAAILENALLKKLEQKNYSRFLQLIKVISNSFEKFNLGDDFSSFILDINRKKEVITQAEAFAIFLHRFPEKKEAYLPELKNNIKAGEFIFKIELDDKELEITAENAAAKFLELSGMNHLVKEFYANFLPQLKTKLFKIESKNNFNSAFNQVEAKSWLEFVELYPELITNFDEKIIYLAYLEANQELILEYELELKRVHLLIIYELYLQLVIEENENLKGNLGTLIDLNDSLEEKVAYLEKKAEREERTLKRLETKGEELKTELKETKKETEAEKRELKKSLKNKSKELDQKNEIVEKLKAEKRKLVAKEELLQKWGYNKKEKLKKSLVLLTYQDCDLYKLFFKDYEFINTESNLNDLKQKLASKDKELIVINKAELNTQKLLAVEACLNNNFIIITAYQPEELITETIKKLTEGNLNIL